MANTILSVKTADDEILQVSLAVVAQFKTLKEMIEDFGGVEKITVAIPVHNVNGPTFGAIVDLVLLLQQRNVKAFGVRDRLEPWMRDFIRAREAKKKTNIYAMIMALNYLDSGYVLSIAQEYVAEQMRGMTPTDLRAKFNIVNDFTPEEESEIRRENQWLNERV